MLTREKEVAEKYIIVAGHALGTMIGERGMESEVIECEK